MEKDLNSYSRWLAAQDWIDAAERDARVAYWCCAMEFERRVRAFLAAVRGEDNDEE